MPKYRSYKVVDAEEITDIGTLRGDDTLLTTTHGEHQFRTDDAIFSRYKPETGDFLVTYADDYRSISPRKAFLDGYSPLGDSAPEVADAKVAPEDVARICHEVNRAYCAALGDNSQPAWADALEWQRQSAITGVHFLAANPDAPPSASHESWLAEKQRDGWKYGEVKDPEAKTHPCFVPYDELPIEQRAKDYLFQGVVRAMAPTPAVQPIETQD